MSIFRLKNSYVISLELQTALEAVLTPILQMKKRRLREMKSRISETKLLKGGVRRQTLECNSTSAES